MSGARDEVLVIGAGIAGLVAARELVLLGHSVRVLESSARSGGQLEGLELDGLRVDLGADRFTPGDELAAMLERLALGDSLVASDAVRTWIRTPDARTLPAPEPTLLGIPMTALASDTVALIGRRAGWRAQLDALLPGPVGARSATLGALVRRRLGDEVLHAVVAPIVVGLRGVHPDDFPLSAVSGLAHHLLRENSLARAVARVRLEGAVAGQLDQPVATLQGGTAALLDRLLAELDRFGVPIEHGVTVASVAPDHVVLAGGSAEAVGPAERAEPGETAGPVEPGEPVEPDPALVRSGRVLVAAPGLVAPGLASTDADADADAAPPPRTVTYAGTVAVLVVDAGAGVADALGGALPAGGVLVDPRGPSPVRALDLPTARWGPLRDAAGGRAVVRVHYRDAPAEHPVDPEQARRDAAEMLGVSIPPAAVRAAAVRSWRTAERVDAAASAVPVVGEQAVGADLARIVAHARATARAFGAAED